MVTVTVENDKMTIEGHANYAEKGKDIVCSAISILVQTYQHATNSFKLEKDKLTLYNKDSQKFDFVLKGIKLIAFTYPKNVEVIKK